MNDMKVFTGRGNPELAKRMCDYLGLSLGRLSMGNFPDGEISCKIDESLPRPLAGLPGTGRADCDRGPKEPLQHVLFDKATG